jgi:hypothetical protein
VVFGLDAVALCSGLDDRVVAGSFVPDRAVVVFDKANRLMLETSWLSAEGKEEGRGTEFRLHVVEDGQTTHVLGPFGGEERRVASARLQEIRYAGKDCAWIVSHLGRRLDGAIRIDLKNGNIREAYVGTNFALSPGGEHIAYVYPEGEPNEVGAVFVDDCMVYPCFEKGFSGTPERDPPGPTKGSGTSWMEAAAPAKRGVKMNVVKPLQWRGQSRLELGVQTREGTSTIEKTAGRLCIEMKWEPGGMGQSTWRMEKNQ